MDLMPVFDQAEFKKKKRQERRGLFGRPLFLSLAVPALLLILRFLSVQLQWELIKKELQTDPVAKKIAYSFLGFSGPAKAKARMEKVGAAEEKKIIAVVYQRLFQAVHFLVSNRNGLAAIDTGPVITFCPPGFSEFICHPSEIVQFSRGGIIQARYYGNSLLAPLFRYLAAKLASVPNQKHPFAPGLSFIVKPPQNSTYLKIPCLIYFYLPLLLIILFSLHYNRSFLIAFFYYVAMFLFFDFKTLFVRIPLAGLLGLLKIDVSSWLNDAIAVFLLSIFTMLTAIGLKHRKEIAAASLEPFWLFSFVLLPFGLRF